MDAIIDNSLNHFLNSKLLTLTSGLDNSEALSPSTT